MLAYFVWVAYEGKHFTTLSEPAVHPAIYRLFLYLNDDDDNEYFKIKILISKHTFNFITLYVPIPSILNYANYQYWAESYKEFNV